MGRNNTPMGHGQDYEELGTPDEAPEVEGADSEEANSHDGDVSVEDSVEEMMEHL